MGNSENAGFDNSITYKAKLLSSKRITPEPSREEVRQLVFSTEDIDFNGNAGSCIRVLAPGQYGNKYHSRLYSIADHQPTQDADEFELCVRRCFVVDEVSGEEYDGVASNYLCNLKPGSIIEFSGPVGYPFVIPDNLTANLLMIGMGTGIAPFRGLIRAIYEKHGSWQGKVRLFHGARTGLEMLYLNDVNNDLHNYYDQPTFKAFQAVSPRPALDLPIDMGKSLEQNAPEVWEIVNSPDSRVYLAGAMQMLDMIDKAMANIAGSKQEWDSIKLKMRSNGRWQEMLY